MGKLTEQPDEKLAREIAEKYKFYVGPQAYAGKEYMVDCEEANVILMAALREMAAATRRECAGIADAVTLTNPELDVCHCCAERIAALLEQEKG